MPRRAMRGDRQQGQDDGGGDEQPDGYPWAHQAAWADQSGTASVGEVTARVSKHSTETLLAT